MARNFEETTPNRVPHCPEVRDDFYNSQAYKERLQELGRQNRKDFLFPSPAM